MAGDATVCAMDIGGTHVTAAVVDVEARSPMPGRVVREPLDSTGDAEEILAAVIRCAARLPVRSASRWAIALPGPFDHERGVGDWTGLGKFEALTGRDLRAALAPQLPGAVDVSFHHDADAFAVGEWWAGAARGHRRVVGITLGTGVGSSFLREGRPVHGGAGVPAEGRVDLLRFAGKPLEETVSRAAIRRAYAQATDTASMLDVRDIAERARRGDRAAAAVLAGAFCALGTILAPILAAFEAGVLVVGGSIAASWDLVAGPLSSGIATAAPMTTTAPVTLKRAQHLAEAPLLGAARLAVLP
jgi:glucokinase